MSMNAIKALIEALDPDTLEAIANEIGGEFKHSARAHSLRVIAREQREALLGMESCSFDTTSTPSVAAEE